MVETILNIIMGVMLLACGIQDALHKKILLWLIIAGSILISICIPFCSEVSFLDRIGGCAVGATVIIISLGTKGKIGLGDGILLCATGLGLGFWGNLELFAIALMLAAIVSIVLLILRLADRKKSIPFVPFLFAGYLFLLIVNMKGTV
jgi:leader peptidase (prepilin peptidase)/N-methyltransferase